MEEHPFQLNLSGGFFRNFPQLLRVHLTALYLSPPSTRALEGSRFFERMCAGFGARAEQTTLRLRVRRDAADSYAGVNADLAFALLLATMRPFEFGATTLELTGRGTLTRASVALLPAVIRALPRLTGARLTDVALGRAESAAMLGALATATSLTALDVITAVLESVTRAVRETAPIAVGVQSKV